MIEATRSATSKKPESTSKPEAPPKVAEARTAAPAPAPKSEPKPAAETADISPEAHEDGEDDHSLLERVRARVAGATDQAPTVAAARDEEEGEEEEGPHIDGTGDEASDVPDPNTNKSNSTDVQLTPEEEALNTFDQYYDVYDNPGNPDDPDGKVSQSDIEHVASGDYDRDQARQLLLDRGVAEDEVDQVLMDIQDSANYLQDHEDLRGSIDNANDEGSGPDGDITRSDLSRFLFDRQEDQLRDGRLNPGQAAAPRDDYPEVPYTDERTPEVIQAEEQAVLEAVNSGQPVQFTNGNGQTEELSITQQQNSGNNTVYEIKGADGHTIRIESELGAGDNRIALARLADYYTQIPPELRDSVGLIQLMKNTKDNVAADFNEDGSRIRFFDGLDNLNEEVFDHEFGHGVGYQVDGKGNGFFDKVGGLFGGRDGAGAPAGWQDVIESDGGRPSDYSRTSYKEDFAESFAAYLEAMDNGPEAVAHFEEAYPGRAAILEEIYPYVQGG